MPGNGKHAGIPFSPAQASFESAILNSRCHKSLCISVKEEQMAQVQQEGALSQSKSLWAPPFHPTTVLTCPVCLHLWWVYSEPICLVLKAQQGAEGRFGKVKSCRTESSPRFCAQAVNTDFLGAGSLWHPWIWTGDKWVGDLAELQ